MIEAQDDAPIDRALIDAARPGMSPTDVQRARLKKGVLAAAAASAAAGGAVAASGTGMSTTAGVGIGAKVAVSLIGLVAIGGGMWLATRPTTQGEVESPAAVHAPPTTPQTTSAPTEVAVVEAPQVGVARALNPEPPVEVEAPLPEIEAPLPEIEVPAEPHGPSTPHAVFARIELETALVQEAHQAYRRGEPARALMMLELHEAQFPRGALVTERRVLRILCLCETDGEDQARTEARSFMRTHPSEALTARIEASCVGELE